MQKLKYTFLLSALSICMMAAPAKKLIECSWSNPDTATLRQNIAQMEASTPYQGVRIRLTPQGEGKAQKQSYKTIFGKVRWQYDWFKEDIENLKNTRFVQFTDNFFATGVVPGDVEWFSDQDWETVCSNFRLVSRIAKETGMKGLIFDPEEYSAYLWQKINVKNHSMEEIVKKARQRGQEFGKAIFGEYPDMTLFCYFWIAYAKGSPVFRSFMNGVYDVLPPKAKIVDGHESSGYTAKDISDFRKGYVECKKGAELVDPENRHKYYLQTTYAAALYLEAIIPQQKPFIWNQIVSRGIGTLSLSEFLRRHLEAAFSVSDEYVWTWSEYRSWYGGKVDGWTPKKWEAWLPGITEIFRAAREPVKYAEKEVAEKKKTTVLRNSDFNEVTGKLPKYWGTWQGKGSKGTVEVLPDGNEKSLYFRNAINTNLSQTVSLVPGKRYLLRLKGRVNRDMESPAVTMKISTTWRFVANHGNWLIGAGVSGAIEPTGKTEECKLIITVPNDAPHLFLCINVQNQNGAADNAVVESCELFPLDDLEDSPKALQPKVQKQSVKVNKYQPDPKTGAGMTVTGKNLLRNPEFIGKKLNTPIREWFFWQGKNSKGKFVAKKQQDSDVLKCVMENAIAGSIYQFVKVTPGQFYELRFSCRSAAAISLIGRWANEKRRWTADNQQKILLIKPDQNQYCTGSFRMKAPEGVQYLALMVGASGTMYPIKAELYLLK